MAFANTFDGDPLSDLNHSFVKNWHSQQDPKSGLMTRTRRAEVCKSEFQWIVLAHDAPPFNTQSQNLLPTSLCSCSPP